MNKFFEILEKFGKVKVTVYPNRDYENPDVFIADCLLDIQNVMESTNDDVQFDEP